MPWTSELGLAFCPVKLGLDSAVLQEAVAIEMSVFSADFVAMEDGINAVHDTWCKPCMVSVKLSKPVFFKVPKGQWFGCSLQKHQH